MTLPPRRRRGMTSKVWLEGALADVPGEPFGDSLIKWKMGLPEALREVVNRIATAGGGIWLVGGSVREAILGRKQNDYDLATTLHPDTLLNEIFPNSLPTGVQFGTVTVRIEGYKEMFEVTTLRTESEYGDGRRPDIVDFGTSLEIDLSRRDFTMNAIAVDLSRELIHDPFNGMSDLVTQNLKAVGTAKQRLGEDGLRILRGYRFMDQGELGIWEPDIELENALRKQHKMLEKVANERIWVEFAKILRGVNAAFVLERMRSDGILSQILPGWDADTALQHILEISSEDVAICRLVLLAVEVPHTRWRILEHDLRTLTLSNQNRKRFMNIHRLIGHLPNPNDEAELRRYRMGSGEYLDSHLAIEATLQPDMCELIKTALAKLPALRAGDKPLLNGHAIAAATGLPMGRRLGKLKEWLFRMQIESNLADTTSVLTLLDVIDWAGGDPELWPGPEWP